VRRRAIIKTMLGEPTLRRAGRGSCAAFACLCAIAAAAAALPAGAHAVANPACGRQGSPGPTAADAGALATGTISVPGQPVTALATPDGHHVLAALQGEPGGGLGALGGFLGLRAPGALSVLSGEGARAQAASIVPFSGEPTNAAITPDGSRLLVAQGSMVTVLDARALAAGSGATVLGTIGNGLVATAVATSPDGRWAFVAQGGAVGVYDLQKAGSASSSVGSVAVPFNVNDTAVTPDGRTLLAVGGPILGGPGQIAAIDALSAEAAPASAAVHTAPAGCAPSRVAIAPGGSTAWVTATGSDALLGYDLPTLASGQAGALEASVSVGPAPLGLALADGGALAVVGDTDIQPGFLGGPAPALSVIDTGAALDGGQPIVGSLTTGLLPLDLTLSPDGTSLLVADHDSSQVQVIDAATLPEGSLSGHAAPLDHLIVSVRPRRVRAGRRSVLRVTVLRPSGAPLAGAAVRVGRTLAHTGYSGVAHITVEPARPGRLRVVMSAHGYAAAARTVTALARGG
jgi:DNA-binding beta-propeller fold protein YncE